MRSRIPTMPLSTGSAHLPTPAGAEQASGYINIKKSSIPRFSAGGCAMDMENAHGSVMVSLISGDESRASAHWITGEAIELSKSEAHTAPLTPFILQPARTHFALASGDPISSLATAASFDSDIFLAPQPPPNASLLPLPPTTTRAPPKLTASAPTDPITPVMSFSHNVSVTPNTPVTFMPLPASAAFAAHISPDTDTPSPPSFVMSPLRRRIYDACALMGSSPTFTPVPFGTPASAAAAPGSPVITTTAADITADAIADAIAADVTAEAFSTVTAADATAEAIANAIAADVTTDSRLSSRSDNSQVTQSPSPPWSLLTTPRTLFDTTFATPSPFATSPRVPTQILSITPSPTLTAAAARLAARALTPLIALELGFHLPERRQSVSEGEKLERGLTACSDAMGARAAEAVRAAEAEEAALDELGWELWEAQLERMAFAASEAVRGGWSDWEEALLESEVEAEKESEAPLSQNDNNGDEDGEDDHHHSRHAFVEISPSTIADDDHTAADSEVEEDGRAHEAAAVERKFEEVLIAERKSVISGWLAFGSGLLVTAVLAATAAMFLANSPDADPDAGLWMPVESKYHRSIQLNPEIAFSVPQRLREMELRKIARSQTLPGVVPPAFDSTLPPRASSRVAPLSPTHNGTPLMEAAATAAATGTTVASPGTGGSGSTMKEGQATAVAAAVDAAQMLLHHPQYEGSAIPKWLLTDPLVRNENLDLVLAPESGSVDSWSASGLDVEPQEGAQEEELPPCDDDEAADGSESVVNTIWLKQEPAESSVASAPVERAIETAAPAEAKTASILTSLAGNFKSLHNDAGSALRAVGVALGSMVTSAAAALLWASRSRRRRLARAAAQRFEMEEYPYDSVDSYGAGPEPLWAAYHFGSGYGEEPAWGYGASGMAANTAGGMWGGGSGGM